MPPFTKDEVYELNEWIREKHGTYEEWLRQCAIDRAVKETVELADENDQGMQRNSKI
jgi:hypothetical protein